MVIYFQYSPKRRKVRFSFDQHILILKEVWDPLPKTPLDLGYLNIFYAFENHLGSV